jgi:DNA processing protein
MKNHFDEAAALLILLRYSDHSAGLRLLLETLGSASAALKAGKKTWRRVGISENACERLLAPEVLRLEQDLAWYNLPQHHVIAWHQPDYPELLKRIDNPPAALFVAGNIDLLWHPQIAVVGTRKPSAGGKENSRYFAQQFAHAGWCITSGLAEGVDTSAHHGAIAQADSDSKYLTIAVVATGLDVVYPEKNRALQQAIAQHGAVVSEHPPGTAPLKQHFPSRNRLIAGLSLGCVVIEAAEHSGALITARLAGEMGREVFAVPGSIHNPMARGCHKLIRQGASLVEKPEELIEALAPVSQELADALRGRLCRSAIPNPSESAKRQKTAQNPVWDALGHDFVNLDQLVERTGLTTPELSSMLLVMELDGMITASDGRYARKAPIL